MADPDLTILKSRIKTYLDVNAFDLVALRANLQAEGNATFHDMFRDELALSIAGNGLSMDEYADLTGDDFDDQADYLAYLTGVQAFLFEDGPHP